MRRLALSNSNIYKIDIFKNIFLDFLIRDSDD